MRKYLFSLKIGLAILLSFIYIQTISAQVISGVECDCDFVIGPDDTYIDNNLMGAGPGDVVCIAASTKKYLGLLNFHGSATAPIIFKNCGGLVVVGSPDWYYGIRIDNCTNFRFTGTGSDAFTHGIKVFNTPVQIPGVIVGNLSNEFEIDHVEVASTGFAGILAKTDPDCTGKPNRGNFVLSNVSIHDNFVHDITGEGIYVGFPHYRGIPKDCDGQRVMVLPHDITGLRIFNNDIRNTSREGLQVGCAVSDVEIYNNSIYNFGLANVIWQNAGVHLSTGTTGKFYRNSIVLGKGAGMWLNGYGNNEIFNNVIAETGDDGIMAYDSIVQDGTPYNIINNTFVNCGGNGMKVYTDRNTLINFSNNIVAGYGGDALLPGPAALTQDGNVYEKDPTNMRFEDMPIGNYRLTALSPAVDAGVDMSSYGVVDDFEFIARYRGKAYDAGAFESPHERLDVGFYVYPNPVRFTKVNEPPKPNEAMVNIRFVLKEDAPQGSLRVYDVHGRVVAIIAEGPFEKAKKYEYTFNGFFLVPGMYFYILESGEDAQVKKIIHVE